MTAPTIVFAVGLVAGILCSYHDLRTGTCLVAAGVAAAGALVFWGRSKAVSPRSIFSGAIAVAGVLAGAWLGDRHYHQFPADHVRYIATDERRPVVLEGVIADEPQVLSYQYLSWASIRLEVEAVAIGGERRAASGRVACFVWAGKATPARYGQRVRISGDLSRPAPPMNPGEYDRPRAYANERVCAVLSVPRTGLFEVLDESAGNRVVAAVLALKARLGAALEEAAPGETGRFLQSILLGRREMLEGPLLDAFTRTGTVHILAISGQHLSILTAMLFALLFYVLRVPRRAAIVVVLGFAVLYCAVSGARPSILRATIMIAIFLIGKLVAKDARTLNSLAAAAIVILVWDPGDLMNAGFQLSFAAILGLELLYRPLRTASARLVPRLGPRAGRMRRLAYFSAWAGGAAVLASFSAWVATAPLVLWHFHLVTPGAVAANLAILLPVWLVLNSGLLVLIVAPLSPLAAKPFAIVAGFGVRALIAVVEKLAAVPGIYAYLPDVRPEQVALSYCGLGVLAFAAARRFRPRLAVLAGSVLAVASLVPLARDPLGAGEARFAVLSVGNGLTTVLRTPRSTVLFDCGSGRIIQPGARLVAPYLWHCGVGSIDAIFLSHAHDDHLNAVLGVAERFPVGRVYVNPEFGDLPSARRLRAALRERGIPVSILAAGDVVADLAGVQVTVLSPERRAARPAKAGSGGSGGSQGVVRRIRPPQGEGQNDGSLVLLVEAGGQRVLLPGDIAEAGTAEVLGGAYRDRLGADVVLVPHHGSGNAFAARFAAAVGARLAVASARERTASAATLFAYEEAGTPAVETWASGCVEVALGPGPGTLRATGFAGGLPFLPPERPLRPVEAADPAAGRPEAQPRAPAALTDEVGTDQERRARRPRAPAALTDEVGTDEERRARRPKARAPALGTDEERARRSRRVARAGAAASRRAPPRHPAGAISGLASAGDAIGLGAAHARAAVRRARPAAPGAGATGPPAPR